MIKINDNVEIDFIIANNKKAIKVTMKNMPTVCYYHDTFESIMRHFMRYKAEIGDYPTLKSRQSSNTSTVCKPEEVLK